MMHLASGKKNIRKENVDNYNSHVESMLNSGLVSDASYIIEDEELSLYVPGGGSYGPGDELETVALGVNGDVFRKKLREVLSDLFGVKEELQNYVEFLVHQQDPLGCIPAGYEFLLKYNGHKVGPDFQEKYDLRKLGEERNGNNFDNVARKIEEDYTEISFVRKDDFNSSDEKWVFLIDRIDQGRATLLSYPLQAGAHIMPVVAYGDDYLLLVHSVDKRNHFQNYCMLSRAGFDESGDIAYIKK